jgi:hypothetical protein
MKRRKFSEAFKRKILAEAAKGVTQHVLDKHRLSWSTYTRFKRRNANADPTKYVVTSEDVADNLYTKAPKRQVPLEALVLLRQARKAWETGRGERARYLSLLALTTLEEK